MRYMIPALLLIAFVAGACMDTRAPLTLEECGWPADTDIAFEGWSTERDLGLMVSSPTQERLFWIITAEPVEILTSRDTQHARAACAIGAEGLRSLRTVPDGWQPPSQSGG